MAEDFIHQKLIEKVCFYNYNRTRPEFRMIVEDNPETVFLTP